MLVFSTVVLIVTGSRATLKLGQRVRGLVTRVRQRTGHACPSSVCSTSGLDLEESAHVTSSERASEQSLSPSGGKEAVLHQPGGFIRQNHLDQSCGGASLTSSQKAPSCGCLLTRLDTSQACQEDQDELLVPSLSQSNRSGCTRSRGRQVGSPLLL